MSPRWTRTKAPKIVDGKIQVPASLFKANDKEIDIMKQVIRMKTYNFTRLDYLLIFIAAFSLVVLSGIKANASAGSAAAAAGARAISKAAHKNCECRGRKSGNSYCSAKNLTSKMIVDRGPADTARVHDGVYRPGVDKVKADAVKIIGTDDRVVMSQRDIRRNKYGVKAIGKLTCNGKYITTAFLVLNKRTIISNSHTIYDKNGNPRGNLNKCYFGINTGRKDSSGYFIFKYIRAKVKYANPEWSPQNPNGDLAVLELVRNVPVKPLQIATPNKVATGPVKVIGYPHDKGTSPAISTVKSVEFTRLGIKHEADTLVGSSGSPLIRLSNNGRPIVYGVHTGYSSGPYNHAASFINNKNLKFFTALGLPIRP